MVFGEVTAEFALGQHPIVELELRCLKRARSRRSAMTVFLETSLINERHKWAAFATLSGYANGRKVRISVIDVQCSEGLHGADFDEKGDLPIFDDKNWVFISNVGIRGYNFLTK